MNNLWKDWFITWRQHQAPLTVKKKKKKTEATKSKIQSSILVLLSRTGGGNKNLNESQGFRDRKGKGEEPSLTSRVCQLLSLWPTWSRAGVTQVSVKELKERLNLYSPYRYSVAQRRMTNNRRERLLRTLCNIFLLILLGPIFNSTPLRLLQTKRTLTVFPPYYSLYTHSYDGI